MRGDRPVVSMGNCILADAPATGAGASCGSDRASSSSPAGLTYAVIPGFCPAWPADPGFLRRAGTPAGVGKTVQAHY